MDLTAAPRSAKSFTAKSEQSKNSTKYPNFMGRYLNGHSVIQSESETVQYSLSFVGDSLKKSALLYFIFYFILLALP